MPTHVYANNNEVASKAADGKSIAAFPDVCFSPPAPPVGPMPLPYPNTGEVKDTDSGTAKVFVKDKMSGMGDDSHMTKSMGDEPATKNFNKGMITSALQGKCYFGLWSMDVQMEGKGVPRHLDMVTHNHASMMGNKDDNYLSQQSQDNESNGAATHSNSTSNEYRFFLINNQFGDTLPIIPATSRVVGGKVFYRIHFKLNVELCHNHTQNDRVVTPISSLGEKDTIVAIQGGYSSEHAYEYCYRLESRDAGSRIITIDKKSFHGKSLLLNLKEAWYEKEFEITHYRLAKESEFKGEPVLAKGTNNKYKSDFLYSARGVCMQGSGIGVNGKVVKYVSGLSGWEKNEKNNPVKVKNPSSITFNDSLSKVIGESDEELFDNLSIAVDTKIIPMKHHVEIFRIKNGKIIKSYSRRAQDVGSKINNYHIDNYINASSSLDSWKKDGGDMKDARVKYRGE